MKQIEFMENLSKYGKSNKDIKAVMGLGSVGKDLDRIDEYSDVDFFIIVEKEVVDKYKNNFDWMNNVDEVVYSFQNTKDGFKFLLKNNLYGEMAVFYVDELDHIPYDNAKIWYIEDEKLEFIKMSKNNNFRKIEKTKDWIVNEALTNLYVGLSRELRGEKLSAYKLIQEFAFDRIIELIELENSEKDDYKYKDMYDLSRRFEFRFKDEKENIKTFLLGYEKNILSAKNMLKYLSDNYNINEYMKNEILNLAK